MKHQFKALEEFMEVFKLKWNQLLNQRTNEEIHHHVKHSHEHSEHHSHDHDSHHHSHDHCGHHSHDHDSHHHSHEHSGHHSHDYDSHHHSHEHSEHHSYDYDSHHHSHEHCEHHSHNHDSHHHCGHCSGHHHHHEISWQRWVLAIGMFVLALFLESSVAWIANALFLLTIACIGKEVITEGIMDTIEETKHFKKFRPNVHLLMTLAALGAIFIGKFEEAAMLIVIFTIAHSLEEYVEKKSSKDMTQLLQLQPKLALKKINN